ncbi:unnamed protein product [Urochloa decumbens]|uniref:F-box protein AT5G49610-like beta-propeller domain-containing protein n=1 Tax=Urochloa decumbens TaxID=240449 RepID=A0ABC9A413_9POAL
MDAVGKSTEPTPPAPVPQAASAAQISAVLGNDDIFREILLRLDFPTCLVRAAAVSTRWLRHASDPALLRRFARLHPPRLLGFFVNSSNSPLRFVPLPQPPELAAAVRRGRFDFGRGAGNVSDCRDGRIIVHVMPENGMPGKDTVFCPLHRGRGAAVLPHPEPVLPRRQPPAGVSLYSHELLFHDGGGEGMSVIEATVMRSEWQAWVQIREFQAGCWGECCYSDLIQLPGTWRRCEKFALLANGKLYLICMAQYILAMDVATMSSICIKLPEGVEFGYNTDLALSRADGSGFCVVNVRGFRMQAWRYRMDCDSIGHWELIDTIYLPQVLGHLADPTWNSSGAVVRVPAVGDNADFVFLRIQNKVFYLRISGKAVEKVYELTRNEFLFGVSPFMMVWPPTFPMLNGGHDKGE